MLTLNVNYGQLKYNSVWEQWWRSGESVRLPPMWPGFDFQTRRHMWVEFVVACVASVSVRFRSKERQRNGILSFDRARNETRAKKEPFFAPSLTLVPRSLFLNRTETLATQAKFVGSLLCSERFSPGFSGFPLSSKTCI